MNDVAHHCPTLPRVALVALTLAMTFGIWARLVWPADMEYKGDEIFSFQRTQSIGVTEPWTWTGMNNSADVPHPGMSVWVFIGLARLVDARSPVDLNLACMALNVVALILLVIFVAIVVPQDEREVWWWGTALVCVNPLAVLFHRKIWPPSVMPAITVVLLACWWYRDRKSWAFLWGLVAALAAQIHPGAFFFSAGMALWVAVFDRRSVRWFWAALGGVIGTISAIPWLYHLFAVAERSASAKARWFHPFEFKFWNYWFSEPFGFNLQYSLGQDFAGFLTYPHIDGHATFLAAVLHAALGITMLIVIGRWAWQRWHHRTWSVSRNPTDFTLTAVICGYGTLLTMTGLPVYRHYLIITFPLMFVFVARMTFATMTPANGRRLLTMLTTIQAGVTLLFLCYVHQIDRPIRGDYGSPYRVQIATKNVMATKN